MAAEHRMLAALGEGTLAYESEILRRRRTQGRVHVVEVEGEGGAGLPGGTVIVASGASDDPLMEAMRNAAGERDARGVGEAILAHRAGLAKAAGRKRLRIQGNVTEAVAGVPVLTQVAYNGRVVADGIPVMDGLRATAVQLPFAGGTLDPSGFEVGHFVSKEGDSENVETIVVVRQPALTDLERRVLEQLPEKDARILGRADLVANIGLAAAAVVFVVGVVAGVYLAREAQREIQENRREQERQMERDIAGNQQQDQDQGQEQEQDDGGSIAGWLERVENQQLIESLDPGAAVSTLLQVRTQLLRQGAIR